MRVTPPIAARRAAAMQVELHAIDAGGKLELIAMGRVVAEHSVRSLSPPATELGLPEFGHY